MAPFHSWTIEYRTVRRVLIEHLAFEDSPVFERQVKHVAARGIGHPIELHDGRCGVEALDAVSHAAHIAMATMETPNSAERPAMRQFRHT